MEENLKIANVSTQVFLLQIIAEKRGDGRQDEQSQRKLKTTFLKIGQTAGCVDADENDIVESEKLML